jgi:hypothetical protein
VVGNWPDRKRALSDGLKGAEIPKLYEFGKEDTGK